MTPCHLQMFCLEVTFVDARDGPFASKPKPVDDLMRFQSFMFNFQYYK